MHNPVVIKRAKREFEAMKNLTDKSMLPITSLVGGYDDVYACAEAWKVLAQKQLESSLRTAEDLAQHKRLGALYNYLFIDFSKDQDYDELLQELSEITEAEFA